MQMTEFGIQLPGLGKNTARGVEHPINPPLGRTDIEDLHAILGFISLAVSYDQRHIIPGLGQRPALFEKNAGVIAGVD
jgi:hypothetical protein